MNKITKESVQDLISATVSAVAEKGADFYGWVEAPVVDENGDFYQRQGWGASAKEVKISSAEAEEAFSRKINGAYGERFAMSIGTLSALVANGYDCRIVQFQDEAGVPFDANGWLVIVVETIPVFHVAPWDLDASKIASLVEVLTDNSAEDVCWKETNKVGEFKALLQGTIQSGLDLVEIAKEASR